MSESHNSVPGRPSSPSPQPPHTSESHNLVPGKLQELSNKEIAFVVVLALAGWALASYDFNLVVVSLAPIASSLHITPFFLGVLFFGIYAGMWAASLFAGVAADRWGRKNMWMITLLVAAVFTGLTSIVQNFIELLLVRMVASGFAMSELAVSSTYVNEMLPEKNRGFIYSIVQGGWPLGVFLASVVYILVEPVWGWRVVFLFGIIPLLMVAIGRFFLPESPRYEHIQKVKKAIASGNQKELDMLKKINPVDIEEVKKVTVRQLFSKKFGLRRQLIILMLVWFIFGFAWTPGNDYISYWVVKVNGFTSVQAATMLAWAGGLGYFFYLLGGWAGTKIPKNYVMGITAAFVSVLYAIFPHLHGYIPILLGVFFIAQVTNGTWSGVGFTYTAESFPTRARGTAEGLTIAAYSASFAFAALLWGALFSINPLLAWYILGVGFGFGLLLIFFARPIPPKARLEEVAY